MWYSPLSLQNRYADFAPLFAKAHAFLANLPKEHPKPGTVLEIEGKRLYANVGGYMTQAREQRRFEAHQHYADIHYLLAGEESMDITPTEGLTRLEPYDSANDIVFLKDPEGPYSTIILRPGDAAVIFPEEAHKPGCLITEPTEVLKLVVKVFLRP